MNTFDQFDELFRISYNYVQHLAELIGGFRLDVDFAVPIAVSHLWSSIEAVYGQRPLPPQHEEMPEPEDGYEFDEEVAIEVDIDVDFDENLNVSLTRYLDPTEDEDDVEIDVEGFTPMRSEFSAVQPAPGVPVLEINQVMAAFHEDSAGLEGPVEILPRMEVVMENAVGKIMKPREHRHRHNPLERPEKSRRSARRKLNF